MKFGISSYVFTSPFGSDPYGQFKKAKDLGFDIYEIAVEDFDTIDANSILDARDRSGIDLSSMCGAFGEQNDISSENAEYRKAGVEYIKQLVDLASIIGSKVIAGPMYASVGKACMTTAEEKNSNGQRTFFPENNFPIKIIIKKQAAGACFFVFF